jgi:hypothetical protein
VPDAEADAQVAVAQVARGQRHHPRERRGRIAARPAPDHDPEGTVRVRAIGVLRQPARGSPRIDRRERGGSLEEGGGLVLDRLVGERLRPPAHGIGTLLRQLPGEHPDVREAALARLEPDQVVVQAIAVGAVRPAGHQPSLHELAQLGAPLTQRVERLDGGRRVAEGPRVDGGSPRVAIERRIQRERPVERADRIEAHPREHEQAQLVGGEPRQRRLDLHERRVEVRGRERLEEAAHPPGPGQPVGIGERGAERRHPGGLGRLARRGRAPGGEAGGQRQDQGNRERQLARQADVLGDGGDGTRTSPIRAP